jgi:hypothetical protein
METKVYRQQIANEVQRPNEGADAQGERRPELHTDRQAHTTLTPAVFYPPVQDEELTMWEHWLPTGHVFPRSTASSLDQATKQLELLHAPREVLEEFAWAEKMELFDTYEIRTPERRDQRDPLLLGRQGTACYRIAFWGESLRPISEIADLVQQSFVVKKRTQRWRTWVTLSGMALGLALGWWMGHLQPQESPMKITISTMLGFGYLSLIPFWILSPEHRQQDFLDQYRS